jgi:Flp pilus assembly protein TadB
MNSVYEINKGINKSIEFKGLKAQYIAYLGVGLLVLLILFAVMFIAGVSTFIALPVIVLLGSVLFSWTYRYSNKYGAHGLMKEAAWRKLPTCLRTRGHRPFSNHTVNLKP